MKKITLRIAITFLVIVFFASCSSDTNESSEGEGKEETNVVEKESKDEPEETDEEETVLENDRDYDPEDYQDLSIGETAEIQDYIETALHYEITLNNVQFLDNIDDLDPTGDTFAVVEVSLENLHPEDTMSARDGFGPGFGGVDDIQASLNSIYMNDAEHADIVEEFNLMDGEMAPGEELTGTYIYSIDEADEYEFSYSDLMVVFATWNVSPDEVD